MKYLRKNRLKMKDGRIDEEDMKRSIMDMRDMMEKRKKRKEL